MGLYAIREPSVFAFVDQGREIHGFDQRWFAKRWQRMAGCGPVTAATMVYYLLRTRQGAKALDDRVARKGLIEELWAYVTPGMGGVNSAKMFADGVMAYASAKGLPLRVEWLDVPKRADRRPSFGQVITFIERALGADRPVGFLNLDRGEVANLESWHWVAIMALERGEDGAAMADILDQGRRLRVDLRRWFDTTSLGGGFADIALSGGDAAL